MPKRARASRNSSRTDSNATNQLLKQIEGTLRNQNTKPEPSIKDPIWQIQPRDKVYTFFRTAPLGPIITSNTVETEYAFAPALSTFPNYTEFAALFDAYRIRMFRFIFTPRTMPASTGASALGWGDLFTAPDHDDNTVLGSTDLMQYPEVQQASCNSYVERIVIPNVAQAVYSGSVFTQFGRTPNTAWIDMASTSVPYYGLKATLTVASTNGVTVFDVSVTARIEFKNVR